MSSLFSFRGAPLEHDYCGDFPIDRTSRFRSLDTKLLVLSNLDPKITNDNLFCLLEKSYASSDHAAVEFQLQVSFENDRLFFAFIKYTETLRSE